MTARIQTLLALLLVSSGAMAAPAREDPDRWSPDLMFAQAGTDSTTTSAYALGAVWDWSWRRHYGLGVLTGYTEGTVGHWQTDDAARGGPHSYTQLGVTPVLRFFPGDNNDRWFAELGLGVNYITPVYQGYGKSFSTEVNFGDHLGVGRLLGSHRLASVALRMQHFSNGGIDRPNPGENFVQLRYTYQFKAD
jgi:lipid A 3-O-deacylase